MDLLFLVTKFYQSYMVLNFHWIRIFVIKHIKNVIANWSESKVDVKSYKCIFIETKYISRLFGMVTVEWPLPNIVQKMSKDFSTGILKQKNVDNRPSKAEMEGSFTLLFHFSPPHSPLKSFTWAVPNLGKILRVRQSITTLRKALRFSMKQLTRGYAKFFFLLEGAKVEKGWELLIYTILP